MIRRSPAETQEVVFHYRHHWLLRAQSPPRYTGGGDTHSSGDIHVLKEPLNVPVLRLFLGLGNVFCQYIWGSARIADHSTKSSVRISHKRLKLLPTKRELLWGRFKSDRYLHVSYWCLLPRAYTWSILWFGQAIQCLFISRSAGHSAKTSHIIVKFALTSWTLVQYGKCECLTAVWVLLLSPPHLDVSQFPLSTNHSTLRRILNLTNSIGKLARWRLRFPYYEFT